MQQKAKYFIGEVSELCNISKKTLRFYDDLGLLRSRRNDDNNYRYYTYDDMLRIPVLKYYKQMGFTLEEIGALLQENAANIYSVLRNIFSKRIENISAEEELLRRKLISVRDWHNLVREAEQIILNHLDTVSVRYVEPVRLLFQEQEFTGDMRGSIINLEWTNFIEKNNNAITGPVLIHFSSSQKRIENKVQNMQILQAGILPAKEEHCVRFGDCLMASCYHIGSYDSIGSVYAKIAKWAKNNHYVPVDDCYERYVSDFWTTQYSEQFVTEVLIKVSRQSLHSAIR